MGSEDRVRQEHSEGMSNLTLGPLGQDLRTLLAEAGLEVAPKDLVLVFEELARKAPSDQSFTEYLDSLEASLATPEGRDELRAWVKSQSQDQEAKSPWRPSE